MFLMLTSRHVEANLRPHLKESAIELVQISCCTDFMDAWSRRDMEKKMTNLSQQHFLDFPAHVDPNQSLMKNTLIQFKPVASRKLIFILRGCCP